ncbi:type II toxin-antitoxin system HigB family toxin [Bradyrhizobium sp. SBR1B]|uniref:type II toxin-antitoxin system HigB family toxin n=1 Tax=Bradyrhizobium sp. SBR1B TaxID=2663836 RepID=UPI0017CFD659|nr:mRNA interferase HigB [Bradyrhizobium sp. SBR1B]
MAWRWVRPVADLAEVDFVPVWEFSINPISGTCYGNERYRKKGTEGLLGAIPQGADPVGTWYEIVSKGDWSGPADLKKAFGNNVDFVGDNRAIFDIGGNKYRLVVHFSYTFKTALIEFVGTHKEYDGIDAETV